MAQAKQQLQVVYSRLDECNKDVDNGRQEVEQVNTLITNLTLDKGGEDNCPNIFLRFTCSD